MTRPVPHPPPPPGGIDAALRRIRDHGGRVTPAKRALVELLYTEPGPLSADELVERLGDHDRSVVYRTLSQLEDLGIAEHIHPGHGQAVYRPAGQPTVPVVCNLCGARRDLEVDMTGAFAELVEAHTGIAVDLVHFPLTGTCRACTTPAATRAEGTPRDQGQLRHRRNSTRRQR